MDINFNDKKLIEDLQKDLDIIIETDDVSSACRFFKHMEEIINVPEIKNSLTQESSLIYDLMIKKAKLVGLYDLEKEDFIKLLKEDFGLIFEIPDYDIIYKFDNYLITNIYYYEQRDEFKEEVRNILLNLKTNITNNQININGEMLEPSVENWLKDFRNQFTEDGFLDDINLGKYFANNSNYLALNDVEKYRVSTLFSFYQELRIVSTSIDGMEEATPVVLDTGEMKIFKNGVLEKIPEDVDRLYDSINSVGITEEQVQQKQEVKKVFQTDETQIYKPKEVPVQQKSSGVDEILASYKKFESEFKNVERQLSLDLKLKDLPDLGDEFVKLVTSNKNKEAMVVLSYVCRNGSLSMFLKDNQILKNDFVKFLSTKFSENISENIISSFGSIESVSLFIQFLLSEKLRLIPRDTGIFGMYLANIFKKSGQEKYFPIVYGDANSGMFIYREIKDVAGKLTMK